ncbi:MAG: oligosaccharide flippase family protein [Tabrizicola sp.]|nr:oligosaccharide flippase family protein [Tabrizicola sp.]
MFKSALLILSGQAFTSILLLLRNLIVARLISVEDYGIAATFAISMSIVEMMTTIGLHQLIIQDKDGEDPRLQSVLQGFHLFRSLFSGLILFLLAIPSPGSSGSRTSPGPIRSWH